MSGSLLAKSNAYASSVQLKHACSEQEPNADNGIINVASICSDQRFLHAHNVCAQTFPCMVMKLLLYMAHVGSTLKIS